MMSKAEQYKIAIQAKSDQLNAVDLVTSPKIIRITAVNFSINAEQKTTINYEGDNGKPYKPSKNMARVIGACFGDDDPDLWVGEYLKLFCEDEVWFGKDKTGGIRISHASKITKPKTFLFKERGKKVEFTVHPLLIQEQPKGKKSDPALRAIATALQNAANLGIEALEREAELIPQQHGAAMAEWLGKCREHAKTVRVESVEAPLVGFVPPPPPQEPQPEPEPVIDDAPPADINDF